MAVPQAPGHLRPRHESEDPRGDGKCGLWTGSWPPLMEALAGEGHRAASRELGRKPANPRWTGLCRGRYPEPCCLETSLMQRLRPAAKSRLWTLWARRARGLGLTWLPGGGQPHTATGCWTPRLQQHELPAREPAARRPRPVTGQSPERPELTQRTEQSRCCWPCSSGH